MARPTFRHRAYFGRMHLKVGLVHFLYQSTYIIIKFATERNFLLMNMFFFSINTSGHSIHSMILALVVMVIWYL